MIINSKAFTMIEILLVIVIISILVFFAVGDISGNKVRFENTRIKSDLNEIKKAFSLFAIKNGRYPSSFKELKDSGIIKTIPQDPWGKSYTIRTESSSSSLWVGSYVKGTYEIRIGIDE